MAGWFGVLTLAQLLAVAFLGGVAAVFFDAADQAYLPELVAPEDLIEGNAKLAGSNSAAEVAGRGLAGLVVQLLGATTGLLIDAVSFLIAAGTLLRIRARPEPVVRERAAMLGQVREGLAFLLRDPYLRAFLCFGAAANFALMGYQAVLVPFLVREAGIAPGWVGVLASAAAVGGVLGALAARPLCRRLGTACGLRIVLLTALPLGLLMPLAGPGLRTALYLVCSLAVVAAVVLCNVVLGSFRQSYAPPELLTRVATGSMFVLHATIPLAALVGGALGATIGLRATMWVMTGLLVPAGALPLFSPLRTLRDLPTEPPRSAKIVG
ncbi:MFS transporter [Kitasatospora sp. NPDC048194]|uniref:MFS transporter n=1 Tax=Kitasatospora sp. NPDC048194 TaxID=3364045 RepID=UPI0037109376